MAYRDLHAARVADRATLQAKRERLGIVCDKAPSNQPGSVRRAKLAIYLKHKQDNACVDCGFNDPRALHCDHRNPKLKLGLVSRMARNGATMAEFLAELSKCDIRCANCHHIRTLQEGHITGRSRRHR